MSDIKIERFNLTVDDDWKITIQEEGGAKIGDSRQMLRHSDSAESFIPGPPDEEIPPDQGDLTLLCQGNPAAFWKTLHAVAIQRKPPGVIFGRYLFECLLGKANWGAILAAADPIATIELALTWDKSMTTLHRLNWELMHNGEHFLVAQPQRRVGITRRISGVPPAPGPAEMHLSLPPKILFVTGVPLHDPEIRPAAEYLSMLSEFQDSDRSVNSYILVDAKLPELIQTLLDFKPDAVYFICHGYFDEKGSYLRMKNDQGLEQPVYADDLGNALQVDGKSPKLVVLSACYSAGMPHFRIIPEAFESDQEKAKPQPGEILGPHLAGPMAAELITHGVPVVIGMAGRVSDTACRLFTRRFAESLIKGEPLVYATAQGRRAAHVEGEHWQNSIDWGFPTLFMAPNVQHNYVPVDISTKDPASVIKKRIDAYAIPEYPRFFGRNQIIKLYYSLFKRNGPKIILARAPEGAVGYGKSRLLQELTRRALLDGNIPLPLIVEGQDTPPQTPIHLAIALLKQIHKAITTFTSDRRLLPESKLLTRLLVKITGPKKDELEKLKAADFAFFVDEIVSYFEHLPADQEPDISTNAVHQALVDDIKELVQILKQHDPITQKGLGFPVVFLDQVHEYDKARVPLFGLEGTTRWLGNFGLGNDDTFPIPVVITFEDNTTFRNDLETTQNLNRVRTEDIEPFNQSNGEDLLAYGRFLLYPDKDETIVDLKAPLVADPQAEASVVQVIHAFFKRDIQGIPKNMVDSKLGKSTFLIARNSNYFKPADDAAFIQRNKENL